MYVALRFRFIHLMLSVVQWVAIALLPVYCAMSLDSHCNLNFFVAVTYKIGLCRPYI